MSREQELKASIDELADRINTLEEQQKQLKEQRRKLILEHISCVHGVRPGVIVICQRNNGRVKRGDELLVSEVQVGFWDHDKPWVMAKHKKKNGEWSDQEINIYSDWRLKDE